MRPLHRVAFIAMLASLVSACSELPGSGPRSADINQAEQQPAEAGVGIQVVDVTDGVARSLTAKHHATSFLEALGSNPAPEERIGAGDTLQVTLWEAPPATLFSNAQATAPGTPATSQATALPDQPVDADGTIAVPFAGRIAAAGRTARAVGDEISKRLAGKANHPEVLVRITSNRSSMVTVVGEVNASARVPLTASGERLLDALAAAGGVRQAVNKTTIQVTRGDRYYAQSLDQIIRDPRQNVPLHAGDVVTAMYQPLSFVALGATGKQDEISFEAQGVTLAQALARSNGLTDSRANARGVFIFRLEPQDALDWPRHPVATTPDGLVPVIYRIDLRDPRSFFVMQSFAMNDKDILYVSNSPTAELQKFLNLVFSATYPLLQLSNTLQ
jgi:polysaccharide export outer membrane protein